MSVHDTEIWISTGVMGHSPHLRDIILASKKDNIYSWHWMTRNGSVSHWLKWRNNV